MGVFKGYESIATYKKLKVMRDLCFRDLTVSLTYTFLTEEQFHLKVIGQMPTCING